VSDALALARDSGLIRSGEPLLVLISGGADSVCLLDVALRLGASVSALHVNYGLRAEADADEAHCRELCERLGVELRVERVELAAARGPGNVQDEAREARYALAERHARGDYATGHTASDQAETVLYRLAVSPGSRALLGMEPRRGRLVRPLLHATREQTRAWCESRGLGWREDASNLDPGFARSRIRHEVLPALRDLNPAAERGIAETSAQLRDEAEVLESAVDDALGTTGVGGVAVSELRSLPPALARLMLRRLAEAASGGIHPLSREQAEAVMRLGKKPGSASLDLGRGLRAVSEYGTIRFALGPDAPPPDPVRLAVPGAARFGPWEVEARLGRGGEAELSAAEIGRQLVVRAWREGDRMRPAGLGGGKSLQDLFTDRKVPRALRQTLPVVETGGEIAWVAGVAVGERFRARVDEEVVSLSARRTVP
jgi:tRNA(Ile)-lysidine synthase